MADVTLHGQRWAVPESGAAVVIAKSAAERTELASALRAADAVAPEDWFRPWAPTMPKDFEALLESKTGNAKLAEEHAALLQLLDAASNSGVVVASTGSRLSIKAAQEHLKNRLREADAQLATALEQAAMAPQRIAETLARYQALRSAAVSRRLDHQRSALKSARDAADKQEQGRRRLAELGVAAHVSRTQAGALEEHLYELRQALAEAAAVVSAPGAAVPPPAAPGWADVEASLLSGLSERLQLALTAWRHARAMQSDADAEAGKAMGRALDAPHLESLAAQLADQPGTGFDALEQVSAHAAPSLSELETRANRARAQRDAAKSWAGAAWGAMALGIAAGAVLLFGGMPGLGGAVAAAAIGVFSAVAIALGGRAARAGAELEQAIEAKLQAPPIPDGETLSLVAARAREIRSANDARQTAKEATESVATAWAQLTAEVAALPSELQHTLAAADSLPAQDAVLAAWCDAADRESERRQLVAKNAELGRRAEALKERTARASGRVVEALRACGYGVVEGQDGTALEAQASRLAADIAEATVLAQQLEQPTVPVGPLEREVERLEQELRQIESGATSRGDALDDAEGAAWSEYNAALTATNQAQEAATAVQERRNQLLQECRLVDEFAGQVEQVRAWANDCAGQLRTDWQSRLEESAAVYRAPRSSDPGRWNPLASPPTTPTDSLAAALALAECLGLRRIVLAEPLAEEDDTAWRGLADALAIWAQRTGGLALLVTCHAWRERAAREIDSTSIQWITVHPSLHE